MMEEKDFKSLVLFQHQRDVTRISKFFLSYLEELKDNPNHNFSEDAFRRVRKDILDNLNDAKRDFEDFVEKLRVKI